VQLATDKKVKLDDVRLYLEASEATKEFVGSYFGKQLYFDYTHLVCRTALDGNTAFSHPPVILPNNIVTETGLWPIVTGHVVSVLVNVGIRCYCVEQRHNTTSKYKLGTCSVQWMFKISLRHQLSRTLCSWSWPKSLHHITRMAIWRCCKGAV